MRRSRSLERQFILTCARTGTMPGRIHELVRGSPHWSTILEWATQLGVAPLLYSNLKKVTDSTQVPKDVIKQLGESYYRVAIQNMNRYRRLQELLVAFSQENIPVIVLKGAALAELVYQNIALRPMKDLDLLVRNKALDAADHLLERLHYVPDESYQSREWYSNHHYHLAPYVTQDRSLTLELHHHIIRLGDSVQIPIEDLWQRARPAEIASTSTFVFSPEDLLLHLCFHLAYTDRFLGKLTALCDIAETISRYKKEIDWAQVLRHAQTYNAERYLYYPLWLAQGMLEAEIPAGILSDLESSAHGRTFVDQSLKFIIRRAVLICDPAASPVPSWVVSHTSAELLSTSRNLDKMRTIFKEFCQRFVRSARHASPRHPVLAPLYSIFIHPFYLMVRTVDRLARRGRRKGSVTKGW